VIALSVLYKPLRFPRWEGRWICLPAKSFVGSSSGEQPCIYAIEVGKVCIDLQYPVGLGNDDGADIDSTDRSA
jgi:hypothetical protein